MNPSLLILSATPICPLHAKRYRHCLSIRENISYFSNVLNQPLTFAGFATAPGQVALDGEGANSPFSAALSRHIGTPGLEVQQMLTRVRAEVVAATKGKQVPWSNSSLLGEVYLAEK